jgi:hypothetical protein
MASELVIYLNPLPRGDDFWTCVRTSAATGSTDLGLVKQIRRAYVPSAMAIAQSEVLVL